MNSEDARLTTFGESCSSRWERTRGGGYKEAISPRYVVEDASRNPGFGMDAEHQLVTVREALLHAVELFSDDSFANYYLGEWGGCAAI